MDVRVTKLSDLDSIQEIYAHARKEMIKNGNPNQWKNVSPRLEDILVDINNQNSYVIYEGDVIYGVFSLIIGEDPTYSYIDGAWPNNNKYGTIHKIASNNLVKGILKRAVDYSLGKISTLRIDTHEDNKIMRHLVEKLGFAYCGVIYLKDGSPRLAYQIDKA